MLEIGKITTGKGEPVASGSYEMPNAVKIMNGSANSRFEPAGCCIYCGAKEYAPGSTRRLGDEHIIPEGVGGTLILPEASCKIHEDITKRIEGSILRTILWAPRHRLGLKRKKRRREDGNPFQIVSQENGQSKVIVLPIDLHPTFLFLPILQMPEFVGRRPFAESGLKSFWIHALGDFKASGLESFSPPDLDTLRFCQFLAKIAHCFAVASAGVDYFQPFSMPLIDLKVQRSYNWPYRYQHVGGYVDLQSASPALHELALVHIGSPTYAYLGVHVRLFASLGAPTYLVVVGSLLPNTSMADVRARARVPLN